MHYFCIGIGLYESFPIGRYIVRASVNEEFDDDQSRGQTRNLKSGIITWQSVQNFWSNYCLSASGILELKLSTCYKIYFLFKLQICKFGAF